jgi:hypothetical protein
MPTLLGILLELFLSLWQFHVRQYGGSLSRSARVSLEAQKISKIKYILGSGFPHVILPWPLLFPRNAWFHHHRRCYY